MGSKKSKAKDYHNLDEALLNKLAKETLKWNPGFGKSKIKDYHRSFFVCLYTWLQPDILD
jgi:hypothetical protein